HRKRELSPTNPSSTDSRFRFFCSAARTQRSHHRPDRHTGRSSGAPPWLPPRISESSRPFRSNARIHQAVRETAELRPPIRNTASEAALQKLSFRRFALHAGFFPALPRENRPAGCPDGPPGLATWTQPVRERTAKPDSW